MAKMYQNDNKICQSAAKYIRIQNGSKLFKLTFINTNIFPPKFTQVGILVCKYIYHLATLRLTLWFGLESIIFV
jgi:hypothetical protein